MVRVRLTVLWVVLAAGFCAPGSPAAESVWLLGRFHVVWNGQPRVFLIDDQGVVTNLLVADAILRDAGGLTALNQRRVRVSGERTPDPRPTVRVGSIEPIRAGTSP